MIADYKPLKQLLLDNTNWCGFFYIWIEVCQVWHVAMKLQHTDCIHLLCSDQSVIIVVKNNITCRCMSKCIESPCLSMLYQKTL